MAFSESHKRILRSAEVSQTVNALLADAIR
jgi:hypothetical protein